MNRYSGYHIALIGSAFVVDSTLVSIPSLVIGTAKMDFWLSYLIPVPVIALGLWMLAIVCSRFPGQDLTEAAIMRFPFLGRAAILLYVLFSMLILTRDIRVAVEFVNISLLPRTPLWMIALLITITILYMALKGRDSISIMGGLWQPILNLTIIAISLILARDFRFMYLEPMFEYGLMPSIQGSWFAFPYLGELLILPFLFGGRGYTARNGLYGLLLGVVVLEFINFETVLTLGTHIPAKTIYPSYELVRQIKLTDFLDRFDLPLVGIWMPAMIIKTGFSLYFAAYGLNKIIPTFRFSRLAVGAGAAALLLSLYAFRNSIQLLEINVSIVPFSALPFYSALPLFLFLFLRPKQKAAE